MSGAKQCNSYEAKTQEKLNVLITSTEDLMNL